jgi:predicted aspartyl protease
MNTYFDEFGHLVVDMEVKGGLDSKAVSAFIDTCFDGYICLPTEIAVQLGLLLFAYEPYELADGSEKKGLVFLGSAKFSDDDEEMPVEIVLTESMDTLVGIAMLMEKLPLLFFLIKLFLLGKEKVWSEMKMEVDFKERSIKIEKS